VVPRTHHTDMNARRLRHISAALPRIVADTSSIKTMLQCE
jgi:hypothetical protein